MKSFIFQAEGLADYTKWFETIRTAIEARVLAVSNEEASHVKADVQADTIVSRSRASSTAPAYASGSASNGVSRNDDILSVNKTCAECGRTEPSWVSISLGCVICIDCSGIHR